MHFLVQKHAHGTITTTRTATVSRVRCAGEREQTIRLHRIDTDQRPSGLVLLRSPCAVPSLARTLKQRHTQYRWRLIA